MNEKVLHMIGNAHIDAVWLWQWQGGFGEVLATFRSALDLMREYPDFVFTCSSAAYYAWVEENDPAMFAEIRARVAEGRWKPVGGWWVEPDCNLPCGESFVRQGLFGQRYFQRAFGQRATVGYNVDSFGHSGMLPQILAGMGIGRYVFMRPDEGEKKLPGSSFWWESPDGSRVLAYRIPIAYTTSGKVLARHVEACIALLSETAPELMCFYGVGNHGGGPTRANIESIRRIGKSEGGIELRMSSPEDFFARIERRSDRLPVVRDDLQHHSRGCYSAVSEVKRLNRTAEIALLNAEKLACAAFLLTSRRPSVDLTGAWRNVLFNQFHDILAGTSIEPAYEDARDQYGEAQAIASRSINSSLQAIAWAIDIPAEGQTKPLVVFNPNCFPLRAAVELEFLHDGQVGESGMRDIDELVDDIGASVPFQLVQSEAATPHRTRLCFAADVGALGYRVYRIRPMNAAEGNTGFPSPLQSGPTWAENNELRVEIDRESGSIGRLLDKSANVDVLRAASARALVLSDKSDTWSHGVARFDDVIGEFKAESVRVVENGPVRVVIRSLSRYHESTLIQDFILCEGARYLDVRVTLEWHERLRLLKLGFPVRMRNGIATYEIPYGTIEREMNGNEEPGQTWVDLSGVHEDSKKGYGLTLANTSKYSYSFEDDTIFLTVARSPIFAHHTPLLPDPDRDYRWIDQGEQRFSYRLIPHELGWRQARTPLHAASLNNPLVPILTTFHTGPLEPRRSVIRVDKDNITITALKFAEEGDDLILRCHESHGVQTKFTIEIESAARSPHASRVIRGELRPYAIVTFRVPCDGAAPVQEVNLLEEP